MATHGSYHMLSMPINTPSLRCQGKEKCPLLPRAFGSACYSACAGEAGLAPFRYTAARLKRPRERPRTR